MANDETKVEISIEASQNTGAITTAGANVEALKGKLDELVQKHHGEALKEDTERYEKALRGVKPAAEEASTATKLYKDANDALNSSLAQFAGAAAIGSFFKAAVAASLEEAEALRVLKGSVESTGASWERYKGQIEEYAAAQQASTRFDDTKTFEVLGKLALATRSVGEAMRATSLAQDLSVQSGKSIETTTQIINQLLQGESRALLQVNKEFGNYAGGAQTAQQALDNLEKSVRGAASAEESHTKTLAQSKNFLGDFAQKVGDGIVPVLAVLSNSLAFVVKGYQQLGEVIGGTMAIAASVTMTQAEVMSAVLRGQFREAARLAVQGKESLVTIAEETAASVAAIEDAYNGKASSDGGESDRLKAREGVAEATKAAADKLEIQKKLSEETNAIINDEFDLRRIKLNEEIEAAREAGIEKIAFQQGGIEQEIGLADFKSIQELRIATDQANALGSIEAKKTADKLKEANLQKIIDEQRKKDFAATLSFISTLQNAKSKELAAIGKAAAITETIINTAAAVMGAYRSLSWIPAVGPALGASAAALVATAGAAQVAMIAGVQLEHGGVTNVGAGNRGGTFANVGENNKREGILPLDDPRAMGYVGAAVAEALSKQGGGMGGGNTFYLSVTAGPTWREIVDALIESADRDPEMIRLARKLGDLNELHAGRAS